LYHWVIIPTYQDPYPMLKDSFESIRNSDFDNKKIILTLAGEE
jgi:cellulose synthase/poly-beta-1,6-N-acetylglucosamine synthase-like glycosyltransferase